MSNDVMNPETPQDVQVSNAVTNSGGGEDGSDTQANNASGQPSGQSQGLTTEDVQKLIGEALAAFKSELVMETPNNDEENKEENNVQEERSL